MIHLPSLEKRVKRVLNMRHFDVQVYLFEWFYMMDNCRDETGEENHYLQLLLLCLNANVREGVHVVTRK